MRISPFTDDPLLEQPAFTATRRMRVVCIGAGFSGLLVAHKVQHEMNLEDDVDLVIYERNADIGGTWFENTYPGAACDFPAHAYIFPFEGNPDWSKFYVNQEEIQSYIKSTAEKYNLTKYVQLSTTIKETIWNEESGTWKIKLEQGGEMKEDEADFVINASGFLNKWKWPDIPGLFDFKGKLLHSAKWDNSYDWEGKKVAVIGNGASGIQIVASMQPKVEKLVNYMRQPTWISVNFLIEKAPDGANHAYSEDQKKQWREDPQALYEYRKDLEKSINAFFFVMCLDHPAQPFYEGLCKERMHASMINNPELEKRFSPKFRPGCRRITPGDGYLEALQQPNCHDSWDPIERITEGGIQTAKGIEKFDLIVCATGFDSSWLPQWKLVGRDGATLEELWKDDPEAFYTSMVSQMPNYAMINGPNAAISHGSVIQQMSWTAEFILKWVKYMNRHQIKPWLTCSARTLCVKEEAIKDYNAYSQEMLKRTVWSGECRTLYKNGRSKGRVTGVYAGSVVHFQRGLEEVGGEHFDMTWRKKNRFLCLGNGTAETDEMGSGNLAPYFDAYAPVSKE
ncbi:hypothetical protein FSARC_10671 [Fusarium sarcochroum]|uniref:Sterigmatocystin biosynthesis monooxygenase stcW n=1 Tax=Fusarium sarcochroum TaxID=1208366 RepID=A0A8H4TKP4_9HYPO|nr:hypothetical protein FSARC_10671 [Fusarium sarcochroum]